MQREIRVYLNDIFNSIDEIDNYFQGVIREFVYFVGDKKTQRAIERNLEIIGEAANRIYKIAPDTHLSDIRKIIETRNWIIHGYDNVSAEIIWSIVAVQRQIGGGENFANFGATFLKFIFRASASPHR